MTTERFTRQQYLEQSSEPGAYRRYYGQLVNEATIAKVASYIGHADLMSSTDRSFNDIPLSLWDSLCGFGLINYGYARGDQTQTGRGLPLATSFKTLGDIPTHAGMVCVAKEAARQYVERVREAEKMILETE